MKTQKGATLVGSLVAITILATTLVSVLNLQASIIRAKFFLQYDNTANLLVVEGLEIVRAVYNKNGTVANGKFYVDYKTTTLNAADVDSASPDDQCNDLNPRNRCGLKIDTDGAYALEQTGSKIFHRFVEISNVDTTAIPSSIPKVTSTVVVENPKRGALRVYKATIELYKIN